MDINLCRDRSLQELREFWTKVPAKELEMVKGGAQQIFGAVANHSHRQPGTCESERAHRGGLFDSRNAPLLATSAEAPKASCTLWGESLGGSGIRRGRKATQTEGGPGHGGLAQANVVQAAETAVPSATSSLPLSSSV